MNKFENIKNFIFDCDGVLVDSVSSWRSLHTFFGTENHNLLEKFIAGEITDQEFMRLDIKMWKEVQPKIHQDDIFRAYSGIKLMPGARDVVSKLIGDNLRLEHTKLNFKTAKGGEAIEWHQDWAFYPHTNDDIVEVGIFLDDCGNENGPLLCVPGSHKGPIDDHHHNGYFVGAVDPSNSHYDLDTAELIIGKAGSISIHHVRCMHGSRKNNSEKSRNMQCY